MKSCLFALDTFENIDNYLNKTVRFKAKAAHPKDVKKDNVFVVARPAMTCKSPHMQRMTAVSTH